MNLQIDKFYQDRQLGVIKFKGYDQEKLVFDQYIQALGGWHAERLAIDAKLNAKRIANLKEALPPR
jgi:hypothetical protein